MYQVCCVYLEYFKLLLYILLVKKKIIIAQS